MAAAEGRPMREAGEGAVEAPGASARDGVLAMSDRVLSRVCDDLRARARDRLPCPLNRHLVALAVLFGRQAEMALQIVDKGQVSKAVGRESRREVFHVQGREERYLVFPPHYCSCMAFHFDAVTKREHLTCKHVLAARLADALGRCVLDTVDDAQLAALILGR